MRESLRKVFNSVDALFDLRTLREARRFSLSAGKVREGQTARYAFERAHPVALEQDREARLKMVVSQAGADGINGQGRSSSWEFFYDLPRIRAHLILTWFLPWNEAADDYDPARLDVDLKPFLSPDGLITRMIHEGKLLYRQVEGLWQEEMRKVSYLPTEFRDSDWAVADFIEQGLDVTLDEFTMTSGHSAEGRPIWIAQARQKNYSTAFTE